MLKLELKYELNLRFETQIWKPGPDLKMKNLELEAEFQKTGTWKKIV